MKKTVVLSYVRTGKFLLLNHYCSCPLRQLFNDLVNKSLLIYDTGTQRVIGRRSKRRAGRLPRQMAADGPLTDLPARSKKHKKSKSNVVVAMH